jgi:hypothetical protein
MISRTSTFVARLETHLLGSSGVPIHRSVILGGIQVRRELLCVEISQKRLR